MQITKEHFVLRSSHGHDVMGFDSHDQANSWREQRKHSLDATSPALILVRVTRIEEVLQ